MSAQSDYQAAKAWCALASLVGAVVAISVALWATPDFWPYIALVGGIILSALILFLFVVLVVSRIDKLNEKRKLERARVLAEQLGCDDLKRALGRSPQK